MLLNLLINVNKVFLVELILWFVVWDKLEIFLFNIVLVLLKNNKFWFFLVSLKIFDKFLDVLFINLDFNFL